MADRKRRVAIVGGGFAGLSAGMRLSEKNFEVKVFEKLSHVGGLAAGFQLPNWKSSLEKYYHHWFASDGFVKKMSSDLGIEAKLIFRHPLTVMENSRGEFHALDSAVALLRYDDIGFFDRVRMGVCLAFLKVTTNWKELEKETAKAWCEKWMGAAGFSAIWKPLLEGKFGSYADKVNMAWLWARIKSRTSALGTFEGGFQVFVDALANRVVANGGVVKTNCGETLFHFENGMWKCNDGTNFDVVIVAASPAALQSVCPTVKADPIQKMLPFLGAQVIIFTLKNPIHRGVGPYWYSLRKGPGKPFLAMVDHAQFVPANEYGGEHPIYIADYVDTQSVEWKRSDDELFDLAFARLKEVAPNVETSDLVLKKVFREAYAQPVPLCRASENLPPMQVPGQKGLFHASLAHVYPWDRGTNFAIELGEKVANCAVDYLNQTKIEN